MFKERPNSNWGGSRVGAGRPRQAGSRRAKRKHANPAGGEFMEKLNFILDGARDISRDNVKNWKGWRSEELHLYALQYDLDDIILRLDALIHGDSRPFGTAEFLQWRDRHCARPRDSESRAPF